MSSHRIVFVSPEPPTPTPDNAGLWYLNALAESLASTDVTWVTPDTPSNRAKVEGLADMACVFIPLRPLSRLPPLRTIQVLADRLAPTRMPAGFLRGIRSSKEAMAALTGADVIDTQWPSAAAALPALRRIRPDVRLIATLHDVPSQGLRRQLAQKGSITRRARLSAAWLHARRVETSAVRHADAVLVFSDKDRALLDQADNVSVVLPPLALASTAEIGAQRLPSDEPRVLFVGPLYRAENREGLQWFLDEVWPAVRSAVPRAQLMVAGRATDRQRADYQATPGVEIGGFIDDLDSLYAEAAVVVAPLGRGAGVKFKVVEAMARAVPVVATSVGLEGIGDSEYTPTSYDSPQEFADATISALHTSKRILVDTLQAQAWVRRRYGQAQFDRQISALYGVPSLDAKATQIDPVGRDVSIVIPVRNGEHGIGNQLAALAREPEAAMAEVIISNNGSSDRTTEVALAYRPAFSDLRVVDSGDRLGVSHARNVGILAAHSEKILICDHDDEVRPGWISMMSAALDHADVVGGRATSLRISGSKRALEDDQEPTDPLRVVFGYLPYAIGCCLAVRRTAALAVGGFDEAFMRGHEETDFCWRLQQAGYAIDGVPDASVDYRQRNRAIDAARQRYHSARTQVLLWTRHEGTGQLRPVSFRGSLRGLIRVTREVPHLIHPSTRFAAARSIGWALGTVNGHLRYRILGTPPKPLLLTADAG